MDKSEFLASLKNVAHNNWSIESSGSIRDFDNGDCPIVSVARWRGHDVDSYPIPTQCAGRIAHEWLEMDSDLADLIIDASDYDSSDHPELFGDELIQTRSDILNVITVMRSLNFSEPSSDKKGN
jgi:hypothetical protein